MCMMLYIAADQPLPEIPWDEEQPAFNVGPTREHLMHEAVIQHFSKAHVYFVGGFEGCSCCFSDFDNTLDPKVTDPEEKAHQQSTETSRQQLYEYLKQHVGQDGLELYGCWDGDQDEPGLGQLPLVLEESAAAQMRFKKNYLYTVR